MDASEHRNPRRAALRLRPLRESDEAAFLAANREMAERDGFVFGLGYGEGMDFRDYLTFLETQRRGEDVPTGLVPSTLLVADIDGVIVGRTSIRHELNDFLREEGGHIGYGVLAAHRGNGFATEILRQSLVVARAQGVDRVLVTCDDDNIPSVRAIERCGGVLDSVSQTNRGGPPIRRYWID